MLRYGVLLAAAFAAFPANAQQMTATEARAFVVGKLFTYQCFEGTRGAGRIMDNGSVAGTIQFRGNGATRYAVLPHNSIFVTGDRVCASVKGVPFQPCFNLIKTGHNSFRGSVSGLGFAYCDFVRRDRPVIASADPTSPQTTIRSRVRPARAEAEETTASTAAPAAAAPASEPKEAPKDAPKDAPKSESKDAPLELRSTKD
jgi:hypothetical protein